MPGLFNRIHLKFAIGVSKREIGKLRDILKTFSDEEMGLAVAGLTFTRLQLQKEGILSPEVFDPQTREQAIRSSLALSFLGKEKIEARRTPHDGERSQSFS